MNSIAHIVNPFRAAAGSDLAITQPITFQSMIAARQKALHAVHVELLSAQFKEDHAAVPESFRRTRDLEQSVLNKASFTKDIQLPLLADILQRLYDESTASYLIYTNVDIGLYPDFYIRVNEYINSGYDAFIINRRRLPAIYNSPDDLARIYKDPGKRHPGFDCFVFHRDLFPKFKLSGICIGVPFIEISFSQNLFAYSQNFKLFYNERLTFHIGEEIFKKRAPSEYYKYNQKQFWNLVPFLLPDLNLKKMPYAQYPWPLRMVRWGLHPCIPIRLVIKLWLRKH